jgi:hypothetical protein
MFLMYLHIFWILFFSKNIHFNRTVLCLCDIVIYFSFKMSVMLIFLWNVMPIKGYVYNEMWNIFTCLHKYIFGLMNVLACPLVEYVENPDLAIIYIE